jgi:hypothetical protein
MDAPFMIPRPPHPPTSLYLNTKFMPPPMITFSFLIVTSSTKFPNNTSLARM